MLGMCLFARVPSERWLALVVVSAGLACSSSGIKARSPDGAQTRDVASAVDAAVDSVAVGTADRAVDLVSHASPDAPVPDSRAARMDAGLCGNGWLDPGEECDDGNTLNGDGCLSDCRIECWDWGCDCPGGRCTLVAMCGDRRLSPGEECDDGNTTSGDGCSSYCQMEPGWRCSVPGRPCRPICGDGLKVGWETCDDGNIADGDGCASNCLAEPCWDCTGGSCIPGSCGDGGQDDDAGEAGVPRCGDGIVQAGEQCDDGDGNGIEWYGGCTDRCTLGPYCGDGQVDYPEDCDQGSANGAPYGKGACTSACTQTPYCGDGILQADFGEQCDFGDRNGLNVGLGDTGSVVCDETCRLLYP